MDSKLCNYTAAVVVTSDTCFKEPKKDLSGNYVMNALKSMGFQKVGKHIVPDVQGQIKSKVMAIANQANNLLIITVGGTGLCPRDVTPEATSALYDKHCPGISTALIIEGLKHSPHAALSRLTAGIYGHCLIVNFPGKAKACVECFGSLSKILDHALEQVAGDLVGVNSTHTAQKVGPAEVTVGKNAMSKSPSEGCLVKPPDSCSSVRVKTLEGLSVPPSPPISPPPRTKKVSNPDAAPKAKTLDLSNLNPSSITLPDPKPLRADSQYPLVEYEKALDIMGSLSNTVCATELSAKLSSSESAYSILGDILSENVQSKILLPPHPVSTMDGYALNIPAALKDFVTELGIVEAALVSGLEEFEKLQQDPKQNFSFFCYQVNTGGRVPEQNFAIIPVEKTAKIAKDIITIDKIRLNCYVRQPGSDLCEADSLKAGTVVGPVELSVLLSMGCKEVKVVKRPTIGVLSTGDELVEFHKYDDKEKARVIDTNGPLLTALFKKRGFSVVEIGMAEDNPRNILLKIHTGLKESDILIITGGASMGSKDHVKDVVKQMGGTIHFGRVNIKPGKPAAMASIMIGGRRRFIFCLPGNPVSAYITSLVLVLPFIEHGIRGHSGFNAPLTQDAVGELIKVQITAVYGSNDDAYTFDGRLEFARAQFSKQSNQSNLVIVSYKQQSSCLLNLLNCDCLILVEPSKKGSKFLVGQTYKALRLRNY